MGDLNLDIMEIRAQGQEQERGEDSPNWITQSNCTKGVECSIGFCSL